MSQDQDKARPKRPLDLEGDLPAGIQDDDTFSDLEKAGKKGALFGRMGAMFHDALVNSRGEERPPEPEFAAPVSHHQPRPTADDLAMRRAKSVSPQRMIVPEGVIIEGSMTSGSETEISGRVDGDVTVDGRLLLGSKALISGNVRAVSCKVEGHVEGKMECSQDLELGQSGRLNADAVAGKQAFMAGQVFGNVASSGTVRLASTSTIQGDISARQLVIEEGAVFNGRCTMRTPAQRKEDGQG